MRSGTRLWVLQKPATNTNRDDSVIEAGSVEDAIAKMTIAAEPALAPDHHPERGLKVSYKVW